MEKFRHQMDKIEKTKKELYQMKLSFETLFQEAPDPMFIFSSSGILIDSNKSAEKLIGYKKEELIGKNILKTGILPKNNVSHVKKMFLADFSEGNVKADEVELVRKNGEKIWTEISFVPLDIEDRKVVVWIARDITERKIAEEKIKHLNLVLRAIRNVNKLISIEKNVNRLIKGICEKLTKTRGYKAVWIALFDNNKFVTLAESGLGEKADLIRELFKKGELIECAKKALRQSGIVIIEDTSICRNCPIMGKEIGNRVMTSRLEYEGKVYGIMSVYLPKKYVMEKEEQELFAEIAGDVALALHSIEIEKALKEEETLRKAILSASPVGIGFVVNYKLGWANETMYKMTGYVPEETMGKSARMLYENDEEFERIKREIEKAFSKGKTARIETRLKRKDGRLIDCSLYVRPINENDLEEGMVIIAIDMTERKKMEEELRKAYEKMEKALKRERDFKLKAAHYFFNPIVIAKGYLDMAKQEKNIDKMLKAINKAIDAIDRIERVVKNVTQKGVIKE